jgi:chemotaxis protein CheD
MVESEGDLPQIYLRPGEMFLAHEPSILTTILGSCVAATFWSEKLKVGALCHAMLPRCPKTKSDEERVAKRWQYVDFCIRDLARQFDALGAERKDVQVKLFGGADVLYVGEDDLRPTVGKLNCETALQVLSEENFVVLASDLGETFGRKIRFNTASGDVLLARLS